jgi:hypothetical protein
MHARVLELELYNHAKSTILSHFVAEKTLETPFNNYKTKHGNDIPLSTALISRSMLPFFINGETKNCANLNQIERYVSCLAIFITREYITTSMLHLVQGTCLRIL